MTDYDFYETLEDIELVHVIKCGAFEDFRNLEEVKLPNDLEEIPPRTFRNCKSLKKSHFRQSLRK